MLIELNGVYQARKDVLSGKKDDPQKKSKETKKIKCFQTSMMDPTTKSPTSGIYLLLIGFTETSRFTLSTCPSEFATR